MQKQQSSGKSRRFSLHGHWSSRLAFILAVTGSAVGLGNVWKFPYIAGQNGGGAFVLVYLVCVAVIGLPVMMSEILIGRRGRRNPVTTMALLGEEEGSTRQWRWVGLMGVAAGALILSYYSVVAGWTLAYIPKSIAGAFSGASAEQIDTIFTTFTGDWVAVAVAHTVFVAITVLVVARGVERGLERAVTYMVPALVGLMLVLLAYAVTSGGFAAGVTFMFTADFAALTWEGVLQAMGQAFFTLSLGMGAVMAYGAYLPEETSIFDASVSVVIADTVIALLAGLVIFPLVFANGLDPAEGPGLVFVTLPLAFGNMGGGVFFASVFFVLLSFAAWTSALGMIEPGVAWVVEHFGRTRSQAAIMIGGGIWALGFGSLLSFNVLSDVTFLKGTIYNNVEYLTSNILLPLGGLSITVFAAWVMCRNSTAEELGGTGQIYRYWRFLARYIAPAAILLVFLRAVGVIG
jgi:NSS family neurotransmitter:Na+ symporter